MSISSLTRAASGSLVRTLWNRDRAAARRRARRAGFAPAIDRLESRLAFALPGTMSIGSLPTVASFTDTPTGPGNIGDYVTVSIEGTSGTVIFNGNLGVADGGSIQTIEIVDASPDFQMTFNGLIRTANPVPYGSDGIIQLGTITTNNVIRGINTVRGPATNVAVAYTPYGFTQTGGDVGSVNMTLAGDVTSTFIGGAPGTFVVATPLTTGGASAGTPVFTTVSTSSYTSSSDTTAITLAAATGGSTAQGALTTAEVRNVEFQLTKFVGVNFSNRTLTEGGGIFVDTVLGDGLPPADTLPPNVGIVLSQGLLAYSTIGIRKELRAAVVLGTARNASVDGRMFVESANSSSVIFVGAQNFPIATNSTFELVGGGGAFGANVLVAQPFQGVMNLQTAATGNFLFARGVGSRARLNARSWAGVFVNGDFAGQINAPNGGDGGFGNLSLNVARNLTATARVNVENDLSLVVGGNVVKGATVAVGSGSSLDIGGNFAGSMTSGGDISGNIDGNVTGATITASVELSLDIGGSIVNSAVLAYSNNTLDVAGSIRNSRFFAQSSDMSIDVAGSVTNSSFSTGYDYDLSLVVGGNLAGSTLQSGSGDVSVDVAGNVTNSQFTSTYYDVTMDVGGNFLNNKIVTGGDVSLSVGRNALDSTILADEDVTLDIGRNWRGVAQSAYRDLLLDVGGSVLGNSTFMSGEDTLVNVAGNFDGSTTSRNLRFFVGGNVSQASRITAQAVTDWQNAVSSNFVIGGRLDGIVNVGVFDALANTGAIAILGNGAGTSARFNVGSFAAGDTLVFNGNFRGNLRTLQDLTSNLQFNGNVDRITIGGRVGSYAPGVTPVPVAINVAGRLLYLNSNSYFEATAPGKSGTFWNDTQKNSSTGTLTTGSYVTVVPTLQTQPAPPTPDPMSYNVPGTPTGFSAAAPADTTGNITVTFSAPTSNGNLPVIYYEYTTNNGTNWRRFDTLSQGPGTNIPLTVDSTGGAWIPGNLYNVAVRAVNALGAGTATTSTPVTFPST